MVFIEYDGWIDLGLLKMNLFVFKNKIKLYILKIIW